MRSIAVILALLVTINGDAFASPDNACMGGPIAEFGRYVGDWKIEDEQLARDGSGWSPGNGARWKFECIGNGVAIQDHWMPAGGYGTNLRTYNADTGKWEIVWAASNQQGLMHISAQKDEDGNIVMDVVSPQPDPPRRIIFYPPDDGGWNWSMLWSFDGGTTWTEVYRIRATPWVD